MKTNTRVMKQASLLKRAKSASEKELIRQVIETESQFQTQDAWDGETVTVELTHSRSGYGAKYTYTHPLVGNFTYVLEFVRCPHCGDPTIHNGERETGYCQCGQEFATP